MDSSLDQGLPFELYDIWRKSIFTSKSNDSNSLFDNVTLDLPDLPPLDETFASEVGNELLIPELTPLESTGEIDFVPVEPPPVSTSPDGHDQSGQTIIDPDVWDLETAISRENALPHLRTWESFQKTDVRETEKTHRLSEQGPSTLSAAFARQRGEKSSSAGALPHSALFKPLCNLALGRSSVFFSWDNDREIFQPTLPNVPILGMSLQTSQGLVNEASEFGSISRTLHDQCLASITKWSASDCASRVALIGCVRTALQSIECHLSASFSTMRSLLQFRYLIERPKQLAIAMRDLIDSTKFSKSNEDVIATASNIVLAHAERGSQFASVLQAFLTNMSLPWIESILEEIGLTRDYRVRHQALPHAPAPDINSSLFFSHDESQTQNNRSLGSSETWRLIGEAREAIELLHENTPSGTTISDHSQSLREILQAVLNRQASVEDVLVKVPSYEQAAKKSLYCGKHGLRDSIDTPGNAHTTVDSESTIWSDPNEQYNYLQKLGSVMSGEPERPVSSSGHLLNELKAALEADSFTSTAMVKNESVQPDPLELLHPLILAQWRFANNALLQQLFNDDLLYKHLNLQRSFHLFGNGDFVKRMSVALFSQEAQSAERKRGNIPTGEVMGLRLGTKQGQPWPPASSELRLTLMGILNEAYHGYERDDAKGNAELPGGLNFAIRELPESEIDKVVDPRTIYALDFLRLHYTAPPLLDAILTPITMTAYDDIFKFMLRLLRMNDITTNLRLQVVAARKPRRMKAPTTKFSLQAYHVVSTLTLYFTEIGIAAPWRRFESSLDIARAAIRRKSTSVHGFQSEEKVGIATLRQWHESCLKTIQKRLFLSRKYEKLRYALEELFTQILKISSIINASESKSVPINSLLDFDASIRTLLGALHKLAMKTKSSANSYDLNSNEGDEELAKMLLHQLDWNNYYGYTVE